MRGSVWETMRSPVCSIEGCDGRHYARGWCSKHYTRWLKHGHTDGLRPTGSIEERFWPKVDKRGPDECWGWRGFLDPRGYGKLYLGNAKMGTASRVSYRLNKGPIPKGKVVRHTCDNPACVNPAHLILGTQHDNVRDMIDRGRGNWRAPKGEDRHNAILTEDQVRYIRASNERGVDLADRFGIKPTTVSAIRVGRLWKHLL